MEQVLGRMEILRGRIIEYTRRDVWIGVEKTTTSDLMGFGSFLNIPYHSSHPPDFIQRQFIIFSCIISHGNGWPVAGAVPLPKSPFGDNGATREKNFRIVVRIAKKRYV
jgi:hypothetical protein